MIGISNPFWASQVALVVQNPHANAQDIRETGLIPGKGHGSPFQYSCLDNPHGQRSLAGCSSWGHKEWDVTEEWDLPHMQHANLFYRGKK